MAKTPPASSMATGCDANAEIMPELLLPGPASANPDALTSSVAPSTVEPKTGITPDTQIEFEISRGA